MSAFAPDPAFEAGSHHAADGRLCHVRLQDDARFPWLILIPRVVGAVELSDLTPVEQARLMQEIVAASDLVLWLGHESDRSIDKLNESVMNPFPHPKSKRASPAGTTVSSVPSGDIQKSIEGLDFQL